MAKTTNLYSVHSKIKLTFGQTRERGEQVTGVEHDGDMAAGRWWW